MNGNPYMEVSGIEFVPRKAQYSKEQWGPLCYQFHDLFNCLEYEAIKDMCPHLFGTINTGYSPIPTANSTRPDGIYPPGQTTPAQMPQQGGFYPPASGPITQPQGQYAPPQQAAPPLYTSQPSSPLQPGIQTPATGIF